ncbi:MAG TPA: hypothetical protein VET83_00520 [Candidatus Dormibacteraeota bacterium]|nr:hypothetical protein [Candidatus Dormibacteraeota bacterium]
MTRSLAALTVLGALMLGQGAPLMVLDRHCPMQPAGVSLCGVCDFGGASGQGAQVSASSCCKFEKANPTPQTPGVVPANQKAAAAQPWDAAASPSSSHVGLTSWGSTRSVSPNFRSTDSPLTLGTALRL